MRHSTTHIATFIITGFLTLAASAAEFHDELWESAAVNTYVSPDTAGGLKQLVGKDKQTLKYVLRWIDETVNLDPKILSPREKTFYLVCDTIGAQGLIGYKQGRCVSLSISPRGEVEFISSYLHKVMVGNALGIDTGFHSYGPLGTLQILGAAKLEDMKGFYSALTSGLAFVGGPNFFWSTEKYGGIQHSKFDAMDDFGNMGINVISGEFLYVRHNSKNSIKFTLRRPLDRTASSQQASSARRDEADDATAEPPESGSAL